MAKREARQCCQSHPNYEGYFRFGSHCKRVLFPSARTGQPAFLRRLVTRSKILRAEGRDD